VLPQISPGDLTSAHAKFEGMSNCTKCHVLGKQVVNSKCLDCHTEIRDLINSGRGYHSSGDVKGKNCFSCHNEHHGRDFRIINLNKDKFDHNNKTLFPLSGKHSKTDCFKCHQTRLIKFRTSNMSKNSFLGMDMKCISCHEDVHLNTLGVDCAACHNTEAYIPVPKFFHDNSSFKLTGAHLTVECIKCHAKENRNGKVYQKFKGIAFASCVNCHKDNHQGKFGSDCKSCHVIASFKTISRQGFDHSKTNYPLLGKHKTVSCQSCHKSNLESKPKFKNCIDCHTDFHKGDFVINQVLTDCSVCHTVDGFRPSLYTIEKHNKSKFELTGSHLAVSCQNCHYVNNSDWNFSRIGVNCIDCHKNVHGNEIKTIVMLNNNCSTCHQTDSWFIIRYDHNQTSFKLIGKHAAVSCGTCHHSKIFTNNEYKFASLKSECVTCHKDIHFGQFKESGCEKCHGFIDWKPGNFDHNKTKFPLDGAHAKIVCKGCHKKTEINGNIFIKYKLEDFKCAVCHST
jgi:hypothetical protein